MADFKSWGHDTLAQFAAESQAEIVLLNNLNAETLRVLSGLMREYERTCDMFCKQPVRNEAYRAAKHLMES